MKLQVEGVQQDLLQLWRSNYWVVLVFFPEALPPNKKNGYNSFDGKGTWAIPFSEVHLARLFSASPNSPRHKIPWPKGPKAKNSTPRTLHFRTTCPGSHPCFLYPKERHLRVFQWLGMPNRNIGWLGAPPNLPLPAWPTQVVQSIAIICEWPQPDPPPQIMTNNFWELFLGTFGKVRGNIAKKFPGTKACWCGSIANCREEFRAGNKIYRCGLHVGFAQHFQDGYQEQNAQVVGNQAHITASTGTGQKRFWGPTRTLKSFLGVWDFSVTTFRIAEEGGSQLQPQSSHLQKPSKNHPAIMEVQQADRNVCMGNHFLLVPAPPQEPLRRRLRNCCGRDGVTKMYFLLCLKVSRCFFL